MARRSLDTVIQSGRRAFGRRRRGIRRRL